MEDRKYYIVYSPTTSETYYDDYVREPETDTVLEQVYGEDNAVLALMGQQNNYLNFLIEG